MGTRSLTRFFDEEGAEICALYRQFDGYIEGGHGEELAAFLDGIVIVNGMSSSDPPRIANGMQCLAAQVIAHFKTGHGSPGGFYVYAPGSEPESYVYFIRFDDFGKPPIVTVNDGDGETPLVVNLKAGQSKD